jgi:hypothetical protein
MIFILNSKLIIEMNRNFLDPMIRGLFILLITINLMHGTLSGIIGQGPLTQQTVPKNEEALSKNTNPITPQTTPKLQENQTSLETKNEVKPNKTENQIIDNVEAPVKKEANPELTTQENKDKLSRRLYIVKRKYKRKLIVPNEISSKDKRDINGFMKNLKTKRALKAYQKNPLRGVKKMSKREKLRRRLKKNYAKNLKYEFHSGAFNNVYNMTSNVFPIKNHLQKYDDIAQAYSILAHNFDMVGQTSKEDKFKKEYLYGVERQKLGEQPPKFLSRQVAKSTTEIFLKPLSNRKRLVNENVPDEKKTLKQMEAKVKKRMAKYKAFLKKQKSRRGRRKRRRRRGRRTGRRRGRRKGRRRRRRKLALLKNDKNEKDRKLQLNPKTKNIKKNSGKLSMIDRILNGSIKNDDSEGNISDLEFLESEEEPTNIQNTSNPDPTSTSPGGLV